MRYEPIEKPTELYGVIKAVTTVNIVIDGGILGKPLATTVVLFRSTLWGKRQAGMQPPNCVQ